MFKERDIWFKTRSLALQEQKIQLINLQANLEKIILEKLALTSATTIFHENLSTFLGSNIVADSQSMVGDVYKQQAETDEELIFLAQDFEEMIDDAVTALAVRKVAVRKLCKVKRRLEAGKTDQATMDVAKKDFESVNQNMRRELEHFDTRMRDEFSKALIDYNLKYEETLYRHKAERF